MAGSDDDARRGRLLAVASTLGSLGVAGITMWALWGFVRSGDSALAEISDVRADLLTEVPAFARRLPRGTLLTEDHVVLVVLPEAMVPSGVIRDRARIVGRTLNEPALGGELVRRERLAMSSSSGLQALVRGGRRAFTLDLGSSVSTVGVEPGNRVDVIATLSAEDEPERTLTVLRSVEVLAIDDWYAETALGEPTSGSSITLEVAPADAERATHAIGLARGRIRLALVGELESAIGPRAVPDDRIGRADQRMDAARFSTTFTKADVDRMYDQYFGPGEPSAPIVDPGLARGLDRPR